MGTGRRMLPRFLEKSMNEYTRVGELKGIGDKTEKLLQKLNICNIGDLLRYYPREYAVYAEPTPIGETCEGQIVTIQGAIYGKVQVSSNTKMPVTTIYVKDMTGTIRVVWFRMPFLKNTLKGGVITLRGKVIVKKGTKMMEHPEIFYPCSKYSEKMNSLQPVYPLTTGVSNNLLTKTIKQALNCVEEVKEILPASIVKERNLVDVRTAFRGIHFPDTKEEYFAARNRLVFEEFLIFILALRKLKESEDKMNSPFILKGQERIDEFIQALPFELTGAQKRVWSEIQEDMCSGRNMSRLVQGDVGSGKTILSFLGLILVALNGYQGALMAPTEVLAKQHYESMKNLLQTHNINLQPILLTGSMTAKEKRSAYDQISEGKVQIIIGTHAVFQEKVIYHNLALVVTDEQHRFGVRQREQFAEKGMTPHILVMSATPIPRTLAMIVYGDLDISVVDELPSNRLPIKNCVVDTGYRPTAYRFIQGQIDAGRQCYVICPMVEESEFLEGENVLDYSKKLRNELSENVQVDYLHGKMKQEEKDAIMERFARNEIQVLVSTTVIEVGIDVPNATVIMIENAERFGLAQLHQLRGRVGRGAHQSYCIFMTGSNADDTKKRLDILQTSNDGFHIANQDLQLRGPGDLFGIRQSGILDFKMADVFQDSDVLQKAAECANNLLKDDPNFEKEENRNLGAYLRHYMQSDFGQTTL